MPAQTTHPADIQAWLDGFGLPSEAVAVMLGVADRTLRAYARRGEAPRTVLLALDRLAWSEARLCGLPRLTPPLEPRPELTEAVRLMALAAAIDDPADVYGVPDILRPVPVLLDQARKVLRGAPKKATSLALELLKQECWRGQDAWTSGEGLARLRRMATALAVV